MAKPRYQAIAYYRGCATNRRYYKCYDGFLIADAVRAAKEEHDRACGKWGIAVIVRKGTSAVPKLVLYFPSDVDASADGPRMYETASINYVDASYK